MSVQAPPGIRPGTAIAIASAATFVAFLDVTVVNVALPDRQRDFPAASLVSLSWVVAIYGVLFAALLAPAGRLADVAGRKLVFLAGFGGFTLASALCAAAPSVGALIAARALQGAAGAFMIPAALGIVLAVSPPEKRAQSVGLWGATTSVAAAAGPLLGSQLIDAFDWRAVFLINVPIGIGVLWAGARLLPALKPGARTWPDLLGAALLAAGAGLLVVALTETAQWGWLDPRTLACALAGAVLVALALRRATRHPAPAIELALWRNRRFATAGAAAALLGVALFAWLLTCVLFVTSVWDYSIVEAGLAVTPGAFTSAVAAVVAGSVLDRRGPRAVVLTGSLLFGGAGIWMVLALGATPALWSLWIPAGMIAGVGISAVMVGLTSAAAGSLPPAQFAAGTGMVLTARQFGGAVGVAVMAAILGGAADPTAPGPYRTVFAVLSGAALLVGVVGLSFGAPVPAPADALAVRADATEVPA